MKQRYGYVLGRPVYIMDKATKIQKQQGNILKNHYCIQNLKNGNTFVIAKRYIKNISYKYPQPSKRKWKWNTKKVGLI